MTPIRYSVKMIQYTLSDLIYIIFFSIIYVLLYLVQWIHFRNNLTKCLQDEYIQVEGWPGANYGTLGCNKF